MRARAGNLLRGKIHADDPSPQLYARERDFVGRGPDIPHGSSIRIGACRARHLRKNNPRKPARRMTEVEERANALCDMCTGACCRRRYI